MSIFLTTLSIATVIAVGLLNISLGLKEEGVTTSEIKNLFK